jgi:hypothetical protein
VSKKELKAFDSLFRLFVVGSFFVEYLVNPNLQKAIDNALQVKSAAEIPVREASEDSEEMGETNELQNATEKG